MNEISNTENREYYQYFSITNNFMGLVSVVTVLPGTFLNVLEGMPHSESRQRPSGLSKTSRKFRDQTMNLQLHYS